MTTYPPLSAYRQWLDLSSEQKGDPGTAFFSAIASALDWPEEVYSVPGTPREVLSGLGVGAGDYVILPNLSPLDWATAAKGMGADSILIDHHPDHWQLDLDLLEAFLMNFSMLNEQDELILKKDSRIIRAVVVPHLLGGLCDPERLAFIVRRFHLRLGEDITQALGSSWNDRPAGSFGSLNYCNFTANPVLPFGPFVIFSSDDSLINSFRTRKDWIPPADALADQLGRQLVPKLTEIIGAFRKLEMGYRQLLPSGEGKWMDPPSESKSNGLAAALFFGNSSLPEALSFGRLPLPLYRQPPFNTSLYIRQEDWSGKLFDYGRVLPIGFDTEGFLESVLGILYK